MSFQQPLLLLGAARGPAGGRGLRDRRAPPPAPRRTPSPRPPPPPRSCRAGPAGAATCRSRSACSRWPACWPRSPARRPASPSRRSRRRIVLAMDHSGSMQATDVAPSRLVATAPRASASSTACPSGCASAGSCSTSARRRSRRRPPTARRCAPALREMMRPSRRHRDGRRARHRAGAAAARRAAGRQAPARGDRAALRRQVDPRPRPARRSPTGRATKCPSTRSRSARRTGTLPGRRAACRPTPSRCARSPSAPAGGVHRHRRRGAERGLRALGSQVATEARSARSPRRSPAARCCCSSAAGAALVPARSSEARLEAERLQAQIARSTRLNREPCPPRPARDARSRSRPVLAAHRSMVDPRRPARATRQPRKLELAAMEHERRQPSRATARTAAPAAAPRAPRV